MNYRRLARYAANLLVLSGTLAIWQKSLQSNHLYSWLIIVLLAATIVLGSLAFATTPSIRQTISASSFLTIVKKCFLYIILPAIVISAIAIWAIASSR